MLNDKDSPGIQAIYEACFALYPNQPTPPQVTALQKFWLGGPDPLDFISMYTHDGSSKTGVYADSSSHWHYVTYGLSDLYGDARLHENVSSDGPSGFGFELTFRLIRGSEDRAPLWPAMLLQSLARYLFRSQAKFAPGDHIPWGKPLEDSSPGQSEGNLKRCDSRMTNMLIAADPELPRITYMHGWVDFLQVVAVCDEEMELARRWNGTEVLEAMKQHSETGGKLLVSDMRRGESLIDLDGNVSIASSGGSNMTGVTTEIAWCSWRSLEEDIIDVVGDSSDDGNPIDFSLSPQTPFFGINMSPGTLELFPPQYLESVHLKISKDAAEVMNTVIRDRIKFGRHFTFLHCRSDMAVTLVTENITGAFVSEEKPFGFRGSWLQILLNKEVVLELEVQFSSLTKIDDHQLPIYLKLPKYKLLISIHSPSTFDFDKSQTDPNENSFA